MKPNIAFLCLAHNNFNYLEELSHYYCSDNDGFYLHLDANIDKNIQLDFHKNTVTLSDNERYRTRWGTINIVHATLALLKKAMLDNKYERFILISGSDTPLLTKYELKNKLLENYSYFSIWQKNEKSQNTPEFFNRHYYHSTWTNPGEAYLSKSIIRIYTMLILNKLIALIPNKNKFQYNYYAKGSQWWCITKELAEYIMNQLSDKNVLIQFENMHAPDEKVFQTIAINSPYLENINMDDNRESPKQGLHYIDWGFQNKTYTLQPFTLKDVDQAKNLGCAFARKVEANDIHSFISFLNILKK